MNPLRQKMISEMRLVGYADKTIYNYVLAMSQLVQYFNSVPGKITEDNIKKFLLCKQKSGMAPSSLRNIFCGIRFFYNKVLRKSYVVKNIPSMKREQKLPNILSASEIEKIIYCAEDLKTKTLIMCLYGTGARISEIRNLKLRDIDSQRMTVKILGKGNKERYVSLSDKLIQQLRIYWKEYKPQTFLFETKVPGKSYNIYTLQTMFKIAKRHAGITKAGGPHMLRHSYATHLIEAGVPIYIVQKLLGHVSITTTMKYLWVAEYSITAIKSPLDFLVIPKIEKEGGHV